MNPITTSDASVISKYSRSVNHNNDNDNDNDNDNYNDNDNSNTNNVLLSSYKCIQWIFTLFIKAVKVICSSVRKQAGGAK